MRETAPRGGAMVKGLFGLASAGVAAITLMACYGMPPCDTPAPDGGDDAYHCYDTAPMCAPSDGGEPVPCDDAFPPDAGEDAGQ